MAMADVSSAEQTVEFIDIDNPLELPEIYWLFMAYEWAQVEWDFTFKWGASPSGKVYRFIPSPQPKKKRPYVIYAFEIDEVERRPICLVT